MIADARQRVAGWPVHRHDFEVISGGLRKVYKRGHKRMASAQAKPTVEELHEWRKRVKYLWYATRILRPLWSEPLQTIADEIHDLSDYLGDYHDLSVLRIRLEEGDLLAQDEAAGAAILAVIDQERRRLRDNAFILGTRVYSENPDQFVNRFGAYWQAWKEECRP